LQVRLVDDQESRAVGLFHHTRRCARMVGILGDEPLTEFVHDDPGQQDRRRVGRRSKQGLIHVFGCATGGLAKPDPQPAVIGVAQQKRLLGQLGGVLRDHLCVHNETTGGDHHRVGVDDPGLVEVPPHRTDHRAIVENQCGCTGFVANMHAELLGALE
jgi:hypothetical protein